MADDRRAMQRTRVLRCAKIIVPRRSPVIHCTVQNITGAGACLKLANTYGVPQTFDLTFEHGRTRRACRVVWRTETSPVERFSLRLMREAGEQLPQKLERFVTRSASERWYLREARKAAKVPA